MKRTCALFLFLAAFASRCGEAFVSSSAHCSIHRRGCNFASSRNSNLYSSSTAASTSSSESSSSSSSQTASSKSNANTTFTNSSSSSRREAAAYQETAGDKRTLYEILGAPPTATRQELKKRYVELARQSHPDALINNKSPEEEQLEFSEIAAAWRILSDSVSRKRYDRSLQAERVSQEISQWADEFVSEQAKPAADSAVEALEKFAIPLFRRTTATTLASFQAAAQELTRGATAAGGGPSNSKDKNATKDKNVSSFRNTITGAIKAAQRAGQAVDKMELEEKSNDLQKQAVAEYERAMKEKQTLQEIVKRRLRLSLHTPNSGLTSNEALIILEDFNRTVTDNLNFMQKALFQHTVHEEIQELQKAETAFVDVQRVDSQAQDQYRKIVRERLVATNALEQAERAEQAAKLAYEQAQKRVMEQREELDQIAGEVVNIEALVSKSSYGMERQSVLVQHQSERVRNALRQKEKEVYKAQKNQVGGDAVTAAASATPPLRDPVSGDEIQDRLDEMEELRQEERRVSDRYSTLEVNAARLLSKAKSYKERAETKL